MYSFVIGFPHSGSYFLVLFICLNNDYRYQKLQDDQSSFQVLLDKMLTENISVYIYYLIVTSEKIFLLVASILSVESQNYGNNENFLY